MIHLLLWYEKNRATKMKKRIPGFLANKADVDTFFQARALLWNKRVRKLLDIKTPNTHLE